MKRFLFIFIILLTSQNVFAQLNVWRWQNPSADGASLHAVQMISLTTIFACGNYGAVLKSTDGGIVWNVDYGPIWGKTMYDPRFSREYRGNYYGLSFLDSNYGMICGDSGHIIKTTDGGGTWTWLVTNTRAMLNSIVVIDTNSAIVVGKGGVILRTLDGGATWHPIPFEVATDFNSIRKLRPDFLTITGHNGALYKSRDRGFSWQKIALQTDSLANGNNIHGQVFLDENTATIIGDNGVILHTTNGGILWKHQILHDTIYLSTTLNYIDGKDPNILAMVGDNGTILHTIDGGATWDPVNLGLHDSLRGLSFYDKVHATAVGNNGVILQTSDGGETWQFLPSRSLTEKLNGIAFNKGDTSLGIAVGDFGTVMRTTNGGAHWDLIPIAAANELKAVAFESALVVFAVGQHGTILKSTNSGLSWNLQQSGTTKFLRSISFPAPNFGWAVGDSGIVLSTGDGGQNWIVHPFSKKRFFSGVSFPDVLHGYLCCEHGLYSSTDGGATWKNPEDVTYYLNCTSVTSPSANVVCLAFKQCVDLGPPIKGSPSGTNDGGVMTSHDGGKTWLRHNLPSFWAWGYSGVYFSDDLHGTAVGGYGSGQTEAGTIAHTTDGGVNWVEQKSNTYNHLYGVCFGTNKAGTAVGWKGTIMRITTDE